MRLGRFVALAAAVFAVAPVWAKGSLDVELRFWSPGLSGDIQATDGPVGTVADIEDDLGVDSDLVLEPRVTWRPSNKHKLMFTFNSLSGDGDQVVARNIVFGGTTYTAATRVVTDYDIDLYRFAWGYNWVNLEKFSLESLVNVGWGSGSASLAAPATALPTEEESFTFPYVTLGVGTRLMPTDKLTLFGEFGGLPLGDIGHIWDAEFGLRYTPWKWMGVSVGYRVIDISARDSDSNDRVELTSDGFFWAVNGTY